MASQATGGDFYEGAMRGAFVHLFNDLAKATKIWQSGSPTILKKQTAMDVVGEFFQFKSVKYKYNAYHPQTIHLKNSSLLRYNIGK